MEKNKKPMTPEGYLEEFRQTLKILYEEHSPERLFQEWPIDIKHFRDKKNKPIYTQEAEIFMNYSISPKEYLDSIKAKKRCDNYRLTSHDGKHNLNEKMKWTTEKVEAKAIYNFYKGRNSSFKVIDYEVPLRISSEDDGIGEIDLVGQKGDEIYLLELKRFKGANGFLFHMILQSYTYMKLLDMDKFKEEYNCKTIIPSILFFKDSENYKQFYDPRNEVFKKLLKHLGMKVFSVNSLGIPFKSDDDIYEMEVYPKLKCEIEIKEIEF